MALFSKKFVVLNPGTGTGGSTPPSTLRPQPTVALVIKPARVRGEMVTT